MGIIRIQEDTLLQYLKEISSGNEASLEQFYEEYGRLLYTLILSIVRTREAAEEVLQDVLMAMVTHPADKPVTHANAWLLKVITNLSKRKAREEYQSETESFTVIADLPNEELTVNQIENSADQIEALQCLTPIEQQCVMLRVFGQMKLPQVAQMMDMPYDKVRNHYSYAIKKLKQYYSERR